MGATIPRIQPIGLSAADFAAGCKRFRTAILEPAISEVESKLDEWQLRRGIVREPLPSEREGRE